jgi:enediyne biosynthesis protein E4
MSGRGVFLFVLPLIVSGGAVLSLAMAQTSSKPRPRYPHEDIGIDSLPGRKEAQIASEKEFKVFYNFHFTDRVKESGITFVHHAVDDETRHDRPNHYDRGTGLAAADVDGDGLYDLYFVNQAGSNELWKNLGGGKFKNITQEAGVGLRGRISVGASFADVNT